MDSRRERSRHVRLAAVGPLLMGLLLSGCDRSSRDEDCASAESSTTAGARVGLCTASTFAVVDPRYRAVNGKVFYGEDPVDGAIVRVEPSAGWQSDAKVPAITGRTDPGGAYAVNAEVPFHWDPSARIGNDVVTARAVQSRYFEPSIVVALPPFVPGASLDLSARVDVAFRTQLDVIVTTPLPAGQKVAFFATGADAISASGDIEHGVTLVGGRFETAATLYAIAYDGAGDLATATSFATADVHGTAGQKGLVHLAFGPFPHTVDLVLAGTLPDGFTATSLDLLVAFTRTSRAYVTRLVPGIVKRVPNLLAAADQYLAYRLLAHAPDGREVDSGIVPFAGFTTEGAVNLTAALGALVAPLVLAPVPGAVVGPDVVLEASGSGMLEHTLTPDGGAGPTLHVLTAPGTTSLPPLAELGASLPRGAYTWTTRGFPNSTTPEQLGGRDGRRFQSSIRATSRSIVFR